MPSWRVQGLCHTGCEVFKALKVHSVTVWIITTCSFMCAYKLSRRTECLSSVASSSAVCRRLASYRFCPESTNVWECRGAITFAAATANGKASREYSMTQYVLGLERPSSLKYKSITHNNSVPTSQRTQTS
jgi:hypothetical protein